MRLRKINQLTQNRNDAMKDNLYLKFQQQFDYFLNPDIGYKNIFEVNKYYISDGETEKSLQSILKEPMDSVSAFVGHQGIGKSTDIRYSYQITNNAIKFDKENKTIIFPSFFNGFVLGQLLDNQMAILEDIRAELTKRIGSVCFAIEEECPELAKEFYSDIGQKRFYEFLKETNPKAMVKLGDKSKTDMNKKIKNAKEGEHYIYAVTQLKYYLISELCPYSRILIILDNIESLPYYYQEQLILQYLRFYTCIRNMPNIKMKKEIFVNMLFSVRPITYKMLQKTQTISTYSITRKIYKKESVDLTRYFSKKYSLLPKSVNNGQWEEAYNILKTLSDKFDKKYSNMIKNLVYLDIRETMKVYSKILSNTIWITRGSGEYGGSEEYTFNNITVIRALACGSNLVYINDEDNLIPNILYRTVNKKSSALSLYVVAYFINRNTGVGEYGGTAIKKSILIQDFCDVFGDSSEMQTDISEIIDYLYDRGILSISIYDKMESGIVSVSDTTLLNLSVKGQEIWNMLSADSVLMEMYREDYYQDYDTHEKYKFSSSFDLMNMNLQIIIFREVYNILLDIYSDEKKLVQKCIDNGTYIKYLSIFGETLMVEHLMSGVDKSIEYSGNSNNEQILNKSYELKGLVNRLKRAYVDEC